MQVSTRILYPDVSLGRSRASTWRAWSREMVPPVRNDDRGSGYRGTLARGSHQPVNEGLPGEFGDKEVFVARSLRSTLAMLQMHVVPSAQDLGPVADAPADEGRPVANPSFIDDLLSGVLQSAKTQ